MKITDWLLPAANGSPSTKSPQLEKIDGNENKSPNSSIFSTSNSSNKMPREKSEEASTSKQGGSRQSSSGGQGSSRQSSGSQGGSNTGNTTVVAGTHSVIHKPEVVLPQSRVKVIMKSSPEIDQVGQDVVYLITKATELFIDHLTTQTFSVAHRAKNVEYKHLAEMTQKQENLEFLRDIVPQKMTARAALVEMAKQKALANKEILE